MSKHTPAPWKVNVAEYDMGRHKYPEVVHETKPGSLVQDVICTLLAWEWRVKEEERWANANLIAAAPDLLEAARFALSVLLANYPVEASEFLAIKKLDGAIAMAEGIVAKPPQERTMES